MTDCLLWRNRPDTTGERDWRLDARRFLTAIDADYMFAHDDALEKAFFEFKWVDEIGHVTDEGMRRVSLLTATESKNGTEEPVAAVDDSEPVRPVRGVAGRSHHEQSPRLISEAHRRAASDHLFGLFFAAERSAEQPGQAAKKSKGASHAHEARLAVW